MFDAFKWFLGSFETRWLLIALVFFTLAVGSMIYGYKGERPVAQIELDQWKNKEGQVLQKSQYVEDFMKIAGIDSIKGKILFRLIKDDGTTVDGSLVSVTSGQGYIFVFNTSEGKYVNVPLPQIKQVTVMAVKNDG